MVITGTGAALAAFIILSGFFPSSVNWGTHFLGFLPFPVALVLGSALPVLLLTSVQHRLLDLQEAGLTSYQRLSWPLRRVLIAGALIGFVVVAWQLRQRTFFLGDGYLVVRTLDVVLRSGDIPSSFPTAPLTAFVALQVARGLTAVNVQNAAQIAWQVLSVASGMVSILFLGALARMIWTSRGERVSGYLLLLLAGTAQLFFGYVETYPAAFAALIGFTVLAYRAWRGEGSLAWASTAFAALVLFHVGMVVLAPLVVLLFIRAYRRGDRRSVAVAAGTGAVAFALLLLVCRCAPGMLLATFLRDGTNLLPVGATDHWSQAYALFSVWHGVDLANLFLIVSPFSIVLAGGFIAAAVLPARMRVPEYVFWLLLAGPPLAWLLVNNFELGLSRDWDLAAPFAYLVLMAGVVSWTGMTGFATRSRALLMMALFTAVQTAAWIGVNASTEKSIRRLDVLLDFRTLPVRSVAIIYEEIGTYRRERNELEGAADAYARSVVLDSTNARRWVLLGNATRALHNEASARMAYERAVALNSDDPDAYGVLGVLKFQDREFEEGIALLRQAAAKDTADAQWPYLVGAMYLEGLRDTVSALPWLRRAVRLDPAHQAAAEQLRRCAREGADTADGLSLHRMH